MNTIYQKLDLRQSQNLVMTPQLQQAIKLLQLNNIELAAFVESELAQNPLLEKKEPEGEGDAAPATDDPAASDSVQEEFDSVWTGNEADPKTAPSDFDAGNAAIGSGGNAAFEDIEGHFENTAAETETLRNHLMQQVHVTFDTPKDQMIGALLVDLLDEAGYLRDDIETLCTKLGAKEDVLGPILFKLKRFSPSGIFAKDLRECLSLQLEEQGKLDAPMRLLLDNLDRLAGHDRAGLAKLCGVNTTYLADMIAEIKTLNPKPASSFDHFVVQTAIPDVLMRKLPKNLGGGWRVELNTETLPRVLINNEYYTMVANSTKTKEDRDYITTQMNNANWLIKALDQRAQTILKVSSEIVEQQEAFFNYGIEFLKPLTLREIAEAIDMHESTVSRVTTNKYIGTPRGLFELKFFFSTALVSADGVSHSAESIRARIKNLIDQETIGQVLSDDDIVVLLQKDGVDVARRTVAKYREQLHIPSSVQRKRQKSAESDEDNP